MNAQLHLAEEANADARLSEVFSALADPVRRAILAALDGRNLLVSEIAAPFAISLQAVSKHIQVLVRAGLVAQERTGRISRCRLDVGPIFEAAVWLNRYSKYWQEQFNLLAVALEDIERTRRPAPAGRRSPRRGARRRK
ncbi:MAG TPA: metalloregulator ArsR/SmtB family transcription factor [Xanthobacteraceae bacterium]